MFTYSTATKKIFFLSPLSEWS